MEGYPELKQNRAHFLLAENSKYRPSRNIYSSSRKARNFLRARDISPKQMLPLFVHKLGTNAVKH